MKLGQQRIRFQFMELLLYWEGGFTKKQVTEQFNITRQQVSKDIHLYNQQYQPIKLESKHLHTSGSEHFTPFLISKNADEYLSWLHNRNLNFLKHSHIQSDAYQIELPVRNVSPFVIRRLIQAIREKQKLEVDYVSISHPEKDGRIFHPHTFVYTGIRWHVRGYCEKSQGFRDLVLTRFHSEPEVLGASYVSSLDDRAWNTEVEIILAPDPRLNTIQQQILMKDYNMDDGQLVIKTKAALVSYVLKAMQINYGHWHKVPEAQQLILHNQKEIEPWLYD